MQKYIVWFSRFRWWFVYEKQDKLAWIECFYQSPRPCARTVTWIIVLALPESGSEADGLQLQLNTFNLACKKGANFITPPCVMLLLLPSKNERVSVECGGGNERYQTEWFFIVLRNKSYDVNQTDRHTRSNYQIASQQQSPVWRIRYCLLLFTISYIFIYSCAYLFVSD